MKANVRLAYEAGRMAFDAGLISLPAWHLYDHLLMCAGARSYCWHSVATLSSWMKRTDRSTERYVKELVTADLIRRVRRRDACALTYITTLERDPDLTSPPPPIPPTERPLDPPPPDETPAPVRAFVMPMSDPPLKTKLNQGGGGEAAPIPDPLPLDPERATHSPHGGNPGTRAPAPAAAVTLLTAAGLEDPPTIHRLASYPIERIREVIGQVKRQRATPGLVQHKLDHGVSRVRVRSGADAPPGSAVAIEDDGARYVTQDYCPICASVTFGSCGHTAPPGT